MLEEKTTEMNPHIKREDAVKEPRLWVIKYRKHPKDHTKPFIFEREVIANDLGVKKNIPLKYLDDIYASLKRLKNLYLVVEKARQAMVSEFNVNSTFYICDTNIGVTILYVLQDEATGKKFVKKRVDAPIDDSPYITSMINRGQQRTGMRDGRKKQIDSLSMKRFGRSYFYMVHSSSDRVSRSIDADIVFFDEYDAQDQSNETSFRSCADNSDIRAYIYTSTPTLPDYGVDIKIKSTSFGQWTVNCPVCLHDFRMDSVYFFGDGIKVLDEPRWQDGALRIFVCPNCGEELSQADKQVRGRYVHQYPERIKENRLGFQFSQLCLPHITADRAWNDYQECLMDPKLGRKGFMNEKLGEAAIDEEAGARFNREIMMACENKQVGWVENGAYGTSMGVDWGKETHVTILKRAEATQRIRLIDYVTIPASPNPLDSAKRVIDLLPKYQPEHLTCDFGAGQEQNKYVAEKAADIFYAAVNHESMKELNPKWNPKTRFVSYDVVTAYTALAYWFGAEIFELPKYDGKLAIFIQHCCNSYILDPNRRSIAEGGIEHFEIVQKTKPKVIAKKGPIHLLSATIFAFLPYMGKNNESFSFSDVSKDNLPENFDIDKSVRFTRDVVRDFYHSPNGLLMPRGVLCHRP